MPYECAKRGYFSQGNEYTYFMLLGSNFILNNSQFANQFSIFPYIHTFSNNKTSKDPFYEIKIPE